MGLDASVFCDDEEEHKIAAVHLGNLSMITYLRETISRAAPAPILLNKVLYSGSHCGDRLLMEEVREVKRELGEVRRAIKGDFEVDDFVSRFGGIVDLALKYDRPITF